MKSRLVLLGFLCLAAAPAPAAWVPIASPTAADLNDAAGYGNYIVAVGDGGAIVRSTDGGFTWTAVASGTAQDLLSVVLSGSHFYAGGAQGVFLASFDAGAHWVVRTSPANSALSVFSRGTNVCFAATAGGVIRLTLDAGSTWNTVHAGPGPALHAGDAQQQNGTGLVVGDGGSILTCTQGNDWTSEDSGTTANLRGMLGPDVFSLAVGDHGTVLHSSFGSHVWAAANSGTTADLYAVANYSTVAYAVGDGGTAIRSDDLGLTWCPLDTGTSADLRSVVFPGLYAVAVGDGGVILRTDSGFVPCSVAAVADVVADSRLEVFPNPARGQATVRLRAGTPRPETRLAIYDLRGAQVATSGLEVDTRRLGAGVYWVVARDDLGEVGRARLVVLR